MPRSNHIWSHCVAPAGVIISQEQLGGTRVGRRYTGRFYCDWIVACGLQSPTSMWAAVNGGYWKIYRDWDCGLRTSVA
jgi:hypothetical protein